jgi:predicted ester cyclase
MSAAQETSNKTALRRFCDAANSGDPELISKTIDEIVDPDAVMRTPLSTDKTGAELLKEVFAALPRAYPDLRISIEDLIEEGDRVVMRDTVTGTHQGDYVGFRRPATPSATTRSSSPALQTAESPRAGSSPTSSR